MFRGALCACLPGDEHWQSIPVAERRTYAWKTTPPYVKNPPYSSRQIRPAHSGAQPVHQAKRAGRYSVFIQQQTISPSGQYQGQLACR